MNQAPVVTAVAERFSELLQRWLPARQHESGVESNVYRRPAQAALHRAIEFAKSVALVDSRTDFEGTRTVQDGAVQHRTNGRACAEPTLAFETVDNLRIEVWRGVHGTRLAVMQGESCRVLPLREFLEERAALALATRNEALALLLAAPVKRGWPERPKQR